MNILIPLYDNEDSVCGIYYNGTSYYFVKNLQGDIIAVADASNTVVARYSYDAWGVCTVTADDEYIAVAEANPYRYRGYYYDTETGLYYLQSRYYDAEVGRFINGDEIFLGIIPDGTIAHNIYSYCVNDPINNIDSMGMWIQYAIGAFIGGILNVLFYYIDCKIAKKEVKVWNTVLNFLNGATNGLIAATGAHLMWQIIAGISSGVASLFIGVSTPTLEDFIIAIVCGVLSGILAGTLSKGNNKHINYLVGKLGKKVKASIFKENFWKKLLNAFKYVFKSCKKIVRQFIVSYCLPNIRIAIAQRITVFLIS